MPEASHLAGGVGLSGPLLTESGLIPSGLPASLLLGAHAAVWPVVPGGDHNQRDPLGRGRGLPESPTDIFPSRHPRERGREEQPLVRREPTLEEVASEEGGVADDLKKMLP
jgi:hypothetical protein